MTSTSGLGLTSVDIRAAVLLLRGATTLGGLWNHTGEASNTHIALAVTSQGILSSEAGTTGTGEGLVATVCLEMALEIMSEILNNASSIAPLL